MVLPDTDPKAREAEIEPGAPDAETRTKLAPGLTDES